MDISINKKQQKKKKLFQLIIKFFLVPGMFKNVYKKYLLIFNINLKPSYLWILSTNSLIIESDSNDFLANQSKIYNGIIKDVSFYISMENKFKN